MARPKIERTYKRIWPIALEDTQEGWDTVEHVAAGERDYIFRFFMQRFVKRNSRQKFQKAFLLQGRIRREWMVSARYHKSEWVDPKTFCARPKKHVQLVVMWCGPEYDMTLRLRGTWPELICGFVNLQGPALAIFEPECDVGMVTEPLGRDWIVRGK